MKNVIFKNAKAYNYTYTDLAEINKVLAENGISYYQYIDTVEGVDYIMTVLVDSEGNETSPRRGCRVVNATLSGKSNPVQEMGASLTYSRRYSLMMACGLATTDDDAACLDRPKEEEASKADKKAFMDACKALNADYKKVLKQAGLESGAVCTPEILGKANIILKEISSERN